MLLLKRVHQLVDDDLGLADVVALRRARERVEHEERAPVRAVHPRDRLRLQRDHRLDQVDVRWEDAERGVGVAVAPRGFGRVGAVELGADHLGEGRRANPLEPHAGLELEPAKLAGLRLPGREARVLAADEEPRTGRGERKYERERTGTAHPT
ncbi:MAG: hypothetical protein FJ108_14855 [Deltaproteobacteria bacterium]|nr:hypothetical protein [Deltaproteobacteria bacterium]